MKGKQAILRYLETHRTFTAKDVSAECGMTINCITKASHAHPNNVEPITLK